MKKELSPLSHSIPSAFLFLLIGLFAVSSITLTLIGTRVYRRVTDTAAHNSDSQMVLSYLCNKVRTFDTENNVTLTKRDGLNVLSLYETLNGDPYETDIYAWQGAMWENFQSTGDPFAPENGERLVDLQSLTFTLVSPNLLEASVVMPSGENRTLRIALRAGAAEEAN